jgi:hypothetical protein
VLQLAVYSILYLPEGHPVASYVFFLVFSSLLSFPLPFLNIPTTPIIIIIVIVIIVVVVIIVVIVIIVVVIIIIIIIILSFLTGTYGLHKESPMYKTPHQTLDF